MHTVTLLDRGRQLPIGVLDAKQVLNRHFELREFDQGIQLKLSRFRAQNPKAPMAELVTRAVTLLATHIGGHDFADPDEKQESRLAEDMLFVGKLWEPDVMYVWLRIRFEELGPDLTFDFNCPHCETAHENVTADLSTLDIRCIDGPEELRREVKLLQGIKLRGKHVRRLVVQPPLWSDASEAAKESGQSLADYFAAVKRYSIREAEDLGQPLGRLTEAENLRFRLADSLLLDREIAEVSAGPELILRGECPTIGCSMPYQLPINWRFESFFGSSFQPLLNRSGGERRSSSSATTPPDSATRSTDQPQASAPGS